MSKNFHENFDPINHKIQAFKVKKTSFMFLASLDYKILNPLNIKNLYLILKNLCGRIQLKVQEKKTPPYNFHALKNC